MRRSVAIAVAIAGAALLASVELAGADAPSGTPVSYTTKAQATTIVDGFDGNLWFVEPGNGRQVGAITRAGAITEAPSNPTPTGIANGVAGTPSAGAVWVASGNSGNDGNNGNGLGAFLSAYSKAAPSTSQSIHLEGSDPGAVAADSQGNLWVAIGKSAWDGAVEEVALRNSFWTPAQVVSLGDGTAASIATGADGVTMWVTEPSENEIGEIVSASGNAGGAAVLKQIPLPTSVSGTLGQIVLGPDGNMYAGLTGATGKPSYVLQITPAGTITPLQLPPGSTANPAVLAVGPDKDLWMAGGGMLTSMTRTGVFTDYPGILPAGDTIGGIAPDPSADALWLTTATAPTASGTPPTDAIYRVGLVPPPPPPLTGPSGPSPLPPPPTLTATLSTPTGVTTTGVTLTGTITEQAGAAATPTTYRFDYGTTTAYGDMTPCATTTVTPSGVVVSAQLTGLQPYTTYHYQLVANDCTPPTNSKPAMSPDETFTTGSTLEPVQNVDVGVQPVSGTVRVELPGTNTFKPLPAGATVPVGATVGTRTGKVLLVSQTGPGQQASGQFSKGVFKVTQPKGGSETVLTLVSNYGVCPRTTTVKARIAMVPAQKATKKPKKKTKPKKSKKPKKHSTKVVNEVFGNAHGEFKTHGHYATAADQGTGWQTIDRCDGTQIAVTAGTVTVTDFTHHHTLTLTAGHHYLSKAP
jgi:virginiamycin B lyase